MTVHLRELTLAVAGWALFTVAISYRKLSANAASEGATLRDGASGTNESGLGRSSRLLVQGCDTTPRTICYRDTARPGDADEDPMLSPRANWIWFAAAGDSIEISASPPAFVLTSAGQERDSLQNTARRFRHRLHDDGVVIVWLAFDEQVVDTVPYTLRVWSTDSSSRPLRATGETATLTVVSRRKNSTFSLVPVSIAPTVRDRSRWRMFAKTYKVALVSDSLYELCRLPCSTPVTVKLTPSATVVKKF